MTRFLNLRLAIVVLGLVVLPMGVWHLSSVESATMTAVVIEMRDGSRLVGRLVSENLEFESEVIGQLRLPWVRVSEVRREGDPPRLVVLTRSGDRSTGELTAKDLRLVTTFGEINLPRAELVSIRPQRPVDLTGLRHLWSGEGDARDSVGGVHGIMGGAVQFVPGRSGRAFSFVGEAQGVHFDGDVGNFGTNDFSMAFWFRSPPHKAGEYVLSKRAACQPVRLIEMRNQPDGTLLLDMADIREEFTLHTFSSRSRVADDAWHHIVFVRHGLTVTLYVDGKLDTASDAPFLMDFSIQAPLRLGSGVCAGQGGSTHFTGQLDEVRIFNRALKADEVESLFRADNSQ